MCINFARCTQVTPKGKRQKNIRKTKQPMKTLPKTRKMESVAGMWKEGM